MECILENAKIYYEIYGEGYPILMIHGRPVDHRIMKGCMEPILEMRKNYKRIYFDLPGMGKTKSEKWIKSTDDFLKIVIEFVDKIIPNQNFIIVSESYGSYLARGLINEMNDLIDGVLFLVPLIIPNENERSVPSPNILIEDPNLIAKLNPFESEIFKDVSTVLTKKVWERANEEGMSGIYIADNEFVNKTRKTGYAFSKDIDEQISEFNKPVLFLLGRQDSVVGYQDAWKLIESYPRATFAVLDKAGHILQIEQEKLFNSLVNEWLDRVEYFISNKK
ncbi:MAG: alpha/beta hydrolase [Candidatus Lokiarchaeota archaeon]|nr:alpha/beta hydrolase [Candidatus Lokiarchaeota archaeon]